MSVDRGPPRQSIRKAAEARYLPLAILSAAAYEAADLHEHVSHTLTLCFGDASPNLQRVCHYVIVGKHVDTDLGLSRQLRPHSRG